MAGEKVVGVFLMTVAVVVFVYYSLWAIVLVSLFDYVMSFWLTPSMSAICT